MMSQLQKLRAGLKYDFTDPQVVTIGDDVWLGGNVTILPGDDRQQRRRRGGGGGHQGCARQLPGRRRAGEGAAATRE